MALKLAHLDSLDAPGLQAAWQRLSAASPHASLFNTYEWCYCWAGTFGSRCHPCILLAEDESGQAVGLLPGCLDHTGTGRWVKLMGRDGVSGDHLDLLCLPQQHEPSLSLVLDCLRDGRLADGLIMAEIHRNSPTATLLRDWSGQHGCPLRESEPRIVPRLELPASFDAYLETLSANMRYHVRRRTRTLTRTPGAAIRTARDPDDLEQALTNLFELHQRRWQRDRRPGNFGNPLKREFLRRFCRLAGPRDWVRAHVLELDGRVVGVLLAFHWRGTASFYQMGWDPDCPLPSPGVVLLANSVRQAIAERMRCYDFLRGDEAYKWKWTSAFIEQITLTVGWSPTARAAIAAARLKDGCKRAFQQTFGAQNWERMKRLVRVHH